MLASVREQRQPLHCAALDGQGQMLHRHNARALFLSAALPGS